MNMNGVGPTGVGGSVTGSSLYPGKPFALLGPGGTDVFAGIEATLLALAAPGAVIIVADANANMFPPNELVPTRLASSTVLCTCAEPLYPPFLAVVRLLVPPTAATPPCAKRLVLFIVAVGSAAGLSPATDGAAALRFAVRRRWDVVANGIVATPPVLCAGAAA